jgi:hypothetical protein
MAHLTAQCSLLLRRMKTAAARGDDRLLLDLSKAYDSAVKVRQPKAAVGRPAIGTQPGTQKWLRDRKQDAVSVAKEQARKAWADSQALEPIPTPPSPQPPVAAPAPHPQETDSEMRARNRAASAAYLKASGIVPVYESATESVAIPSPLPRASCAPLSQPVTVDPVTVTDPQAVVGTATPEMLRMLAEIQEKR